MANGDILDALETDIKRALQKEHLPEDKRLTYQFMQTLTIYMKDSYKKIGEIEPRVQVLWDCKEAADKDRKETKKMILSPMVNTLITWLVSSALTWFALTR